MCNIEIIEEKAIIKLEQVKNPAELLFEISNLVDNTNLVGKRIIIMLGDLSLTNAHMFSVKSLIDNSGAQIELLVTNSPQTQLAGLGAGLVVSDRFAETAEDEEEITESDESILDDLAQELNRCQENQTQETNEDAPKETETNLKEEITQEAKESSKAPTNNETLYIKQTLRSGRTVNFDGNVLVIGDCHPGSEIIAGGDITIWGTLSGIAHAGSKGNTDAKIRALKLNAIQLRIANVYSRKPDRLLVEKIEKTSSYKPEEARISSGEIIIQSLTDK